MAHSLEAVEHLAQHTLCRRVRRAHHRVCRFERLQRLEQPVVLGVGDLRRVEHVVAVGVVVELTPEFRGLGGG